MTRWSGFVHRWFVHRSELLAVSRKPMANLRKIAATDKQIDGLVYELHGLTEDEVRIVEGGQP